MVSNVSIEIYKDYKELLDCELIFRRGFCFCLCGYLTKMKESPYVCLFFAFLDNRSSDLLHTWRVFCWGPEEAQFRVWSILNKWFLRNVKRDTTKPALCNFAQATDKSWVQAAFAPDATFIVWLSIFFAKCKLCTHLIPPVKLFWMLSFVTISCHTTF